MNIKQNNNIQQQPSYKKKWGKKKTKIQITKKRTMGLTKNKLSSTQKIN